MPVATSISKPRNDSSHFKVPKVERGRSTSSNIERNLRKSASDQNLKTSNSVKQAHGSTDSSSDRSFKKATALAHKHHGSAASLQSVITGRNANTRQDTKFQLHTINGSKSRSNAQRISVNSDLLSRVEKEKKQYEARISELTQVTESRKMEIEKLTFELRRLKQEASKSATTIDELKQENASLNSRLGITETDTKHKKPETVVHKSPIITQSPPDSLGTTTRMTPGGAVRTSSSLSVDWNEPTVSIDWENFDCQTNCLLDLPTEVVGVQQPLPSLAVATLQGRLLKMEEVNYTTNEELQATLQELSELQRSVDEAQEEAHNLAFERSILLEALSTQTTKLEHCRFQIEQLKHLLLTDRRAQTAGSRENHFCELYASIEHEKQVLLSQNNDLAQSSDSLANECRMLTEKASQLQDNFDSLQAEYTALKSAYQSMSLELNSIKTTSDDKSLKEVASSNPCLPVVSKSSGEIPSKSGSCHLCGSDTISRMQTELIDARKERNELREQYEILCSERERETTEWRLYERDLLKTVQVADRIRCESEAETQRLVKENELLKSQVETLRHEVNAYSSDLALTKEKLANLSKLDFQSKIPNPEPTPYSDEKPRSTDASSTGPPSSNLEDSRSTTIQPRLCSNDFVTSYPSHRPATNLHAPYPSSPSVPLRASCMTNGPTVRSLIQSIENKVKAVQHQKRGLASSKPTSQTSKSSATSSLCYFSRSTNPINNSIERVRLTGATLKVNSPGKPVPSLRATHPFACGSMQSSTDFAKENGSAPGGPTTCPPTIEANRRVPNSGDPSSLNTNSMVDPFYSRTHRQDVTASNTTESNKTKEETFSPCRRALSLHGTDHKKTANNSNALSNVSKHPSLERPPSPIHRLEVTSNGVRYTPELNSSQCTPHNSESSTTIAEDVPPAELETNASSDGTSFSTVMPLFWLDPLQELARRTQAGSKRNALLLWCKSRVAGYRGVEVNNFSSSWKNGLALCALLHTYIPSEIPWNDLITPNGLPVDKRRCFEVAFKAAESVGIPTTLDIHEMITTEQPNWNAVMSYIKSIYLRYEVPSVPSHTTPSSSVAAV